MDLELARLLESREPKDDAGKFKHRIELASSAEALQKNMAYRALHDNVLRVREHFVKGLVAGDDGATEFRKAIQTLDALLRVVPMFIRDGEKARAVLNRSGRTDD